MITVKLQYCALRQSGERIWCKEKRLCLLGEKVKRWSVVFIFNLILTYLFCGRYLRHVRTATDSERAGGFMSELACGRAIQDAFSALYLGAKL